MRAQARGELTAVRFEYGSGPDGSFYRLEAWDRAGTPSLRIFDPENDNVLTTEERAAFDDAYRAWIDAAARGTAG